MSSRSSDPANRSTCSSFRPRHWWPAGRTADETSRHAGQRRYHSAASETAGRSSPRKDDRTSGRHRRLELAKGSQLRDHHHRPGAARGCRCAGGSHDHRVQPNGLASILRSKSSAATAVSLCAGRARGAPQARQVADHFHLLQNLRETIETQLSRADQSTGRALLPESANEDLAAIAWGPGGRREVAEHRHPTRQAHRCSRQAIFDQIHTLRDAGTSIGDIARQTGFGPRSIRKWLKFTAPPERCAAAPKPCSPNYFIDYLSRRWAEGCVRGTVRLSAR